MRILDRYIIRNFLGTFFLMVALFCVVAVVFDVAENLERAHREWGSMVGGVWFLLCELLLGPWQHAECFYRLLDHSSVYESTGAAQ